MLAFYCRSKQLSVFSLNLIVNINVLDIHKNYYQIHTAQ